MLKKLLFVAATAVVVVFNGTASAWPDVKMPGQSAQPAASGNAMAMQEGIVQRYVQASTSVDTALLELAAAYGLKDQAAATRLEATAFKSGAVIDKDALARHSEASAALQVEIDKRVAAGTQLDEEGKKHFANSLLPYALGLAMTTQMPKDLQAFSEAAKVQISSASMLDKMSVTSKLAAGTFLVTEVPSYTTRLASGFKQIVTFAQNNAIPVPKDATDALAGL